MNGCPAIVTVPERAGPVFAAMLIPTVPLPVPVAPLATVTHGTFDAAVHAHVGADAVTAIEAGPPLSLTV